MLTRTQKLQLCAPHSPLGGLVRRVWTVCRAHVVTLCIPKLLSIFNTVKSQYQTPVDGPSRLEAVYSCAQIETDLTCLSLHGIFLPCLLHVFCFLHFFAYCEKKMHMSFLLVLTRTILKFSLITRRRKLPSACSAAPLHKVYFCTAASQVFNWRPIRNGRPSGQHPKPAHRTLHYPCEHSDNSKWSQHSRMSA